MSSNGGCALPCWWGFELGVATLAEVRQFYASFDVYFSEQNLEAGMTILEAKFVDPGIEDGIQTIHEFVAQDGVVVEVEVIGFSQQAYQIKSILEQLGQPSEIWMRTIPYPVEDFLPADFRLYFPDQGILVAYATGGELANDETVGVCFDDVGNTAMLLWNPGVWDPHMEKDIVERATQARGALQLDDMHPIEEVSNWGVEQLYQNLIDPDNNECLQTPAELWPAPY